jgi:hypothetical protein
MNRQAVLRLMAAGGAAFLAGKIVAQPAPPLHPSGAKTGPAIPWGRLRFRGRDQHQGVDEDDWGVHPNGDLNLIEHLNQQTSVNLAEKWNVADVSRLAELQHYPFLFMHAEVAPDFTNTERANLREYLLRGGFLFAEDCVIGNGRMGRSARNDHLFRRMGEVEFSKILPEAKLERLPDDHPVFHSVYDFRHGLPHMQGTPHGLHGLVLNGRVVALLSPSDLHCGWVNGDRWFGSGKSRESLRMGANIYAFAMTQT